MLYKSIFHFLLILQKPTKLIILSVSLPNWQNYVNNLRILKNQLTIKNTFVKQMLIFCQFMMFWYDLSKFQLFSAKICSLTQFFSEFWAFKLSHSKSFHTQDLNQIYMMYLCPKIFAPPFWPSWEGCNMVKMLVFLWCSAKQFSALERGREKPKHVLESPDISGHVVYKNWELTLKAETKITKINFWAKSQERL